MRIFIIEEDDSVHKLSHAAFELLIRQDPKECMQIRWSKGRYAPIAVQMKNTKPVDILHTEESFFNFESNGSHSFPLTGDIVCRKDWRFPLKFSRRHQSQFRMDGHKIDFYLSISKPNHRTLTASMMFRLHPYYVNLFDLRSYFAV